MEPTPAALLEALEAPLSTHPGTVWVAYSGGADSHVLLHLLAALREPLRPARLCAVHVNHQLQPQAGAWLHHCGEVCRALDIPITQLRVDATPAAGESPEAAARNARYRAIAELIAPGDLLLTAHHQDDQAETLLLQLLRGAGPKGLAAMPATAPFASGTIVRPLLRFTRQQLLDYASAQRLGWIDDPSNGDTGFDRNYLRHEIMPRLSARWPAAARTLSRSAHHCGEAAGLLQRLAEEDLAAAQVGEGLDLAWLATLDPARRANLLRCWLLRRGVPLPDSRRLAELEQQMLTAREDAVPVVAWPGGEVRRYRGVIFASPPLPPIEDRFELALDPGVQVELPHSLGHYRLVADEGAGLSAERCRRGVCRLTLRRGGERFTLAGSSHTTTLKRLLQEQAVPPWLRERIPLLYVDGQLAAIGDRWICEPFRATAEEEALRVDWSPPFH